MSNARRYGPVIATLMAVALWALAGCHVVEPDTPARVVVEAYLQPGSPAPELRLSQTGPLSEPYPPPGGGAAVRDADVELHLQDERLSYHSSAERPGVYEPGRADRIIQPGEPFRLTARWNGQDVQATGRVPPPIRIDSARVTRTETPVRAVFVDSLFLDPIVFDSLRAEGPPPGRAEHGWAYPVEVTIWWAPLSDGEDAGHWIHTRLAPALEEGRALDDFFLRSEQIKLEADADCQHVAAGSCNGSEGRVWTGVYGIPVAGEHAPLPAHAVHVAIIRSREDYARFASTRRSPERREPISNVEGGLGIVAGIALDSLRITVE